jgi:hypothetical protein
LAFRKSDPWNIEPCKEAVPLGSFYALPKQKIDSFKIYLNSKLVLDKYTLISTYVLKRDVRTLHMFPLDLYLRKEFLKRGGENLSFLHHGGYGTSYKGGGRCVVILQQRLIKVAGKSALPWDLGRTLGRGSLARENKFSASRAMK